MNRHSTRDMNANLQCFFLPQAKCAGKIESMSINICSIEKKIELEITEHMPN